MNLLKNLAVKFSLIFICMLSLSSRGCGDADNVGKATIEIDCPKADFAIICPTSTVTGGNNNYVSALKCKLTCQGIPIIGAPVTDGCLPVIATKFNTATDQNGEFEFKARYGGNARPNGNVTLTIICSDGEVQHTERM